MSQSYCNLLYHIVFSTKRHEPWVAPDTRSRLCPYMGGAIRNEGGSALIVNGTADHVHILARLRQDKPLSDVLRAIKANSSRWIHKKFPRLSDFAWQAGYGAFTVSESQLDKVHRYVLNQERHHQTFSFKAEFVSLLKAHGVEYDDRYLWD